MDSPLGPTLANVFMCPFEKNRLKKCPPHFKRTVYIRLVDDTSLLFQSKNHDEKFKNYYNE